MAKLAPDKIEWTLNLNASQAQQEIHKLNKDTSELEKHNQALRKEMIRLEKEGKKESAEWKNLSASMKANNDAIKANKQRVGELTKQMKDSELTLKQLVTRQRALQREFENTSKAANPARYRELQKELKEVNNRIKQTKLSVNDLKTTSDRIKKVGESIKGFFFQIGASITMLISGAFRDAFNIIVDFEKANARLASVLGSTKDGIKDLTGAARQLGATTAYSAAEVTDLQIELAKLGFAKQDIIDMEAAVLKFATAVGTDLARASAFTGAALRIFGKEASEAEDVLATFAVATTKTALDFSKLETSLSIVGPVAQSYGLTLEDLTALLGQLANAGFDASSAATATRNILLSLADANGDLAKALGQPEKSAEGLAKGLKKLRDEGVDLAKALELTDKRSVTAFSTFLDNADSLTELKESISGVNEEFNAMSDTMSDTVAGAMAGLRSAAEEVVLKLSEGADDMIKGLVNGLTSLVRAVGDVIKWMQENSKWIKLVVVALATYKGATYAVIIAQKAYNAVIALGPKIMTLFRAAMAQATLSFNRFKVATEAAVRSQKGLKIALAATPWGAVVSVLATVIASIILFRKETEKATAAQKALKEAEEEATRNYARQKGEIEALVAAAQNENLAMAQREAAVKKLNAIIPGYNAQIDQTTKKYRASNDALKAYLKSLEKKLRYEANQKRYLELMEEEETLRQQKEKADADAAAERQANSAMAPSQPTTFTSGATGGAAFYSYGYHKAQHMAQDYADDVNKKYERAKKNREDLAGFIQRGVDSGEMAPDISFEETPEKIDKNVTKPIKAAGAAASETVDKIKELKSKLKELRKREPETDAEYEEIEAEKKKIQEQLKTLQGKGKSKKKNKNKNKHEAGTYSEDSIDEVTAPIDDEYQKRILKVNQQKGKISDTELAIKKSQELIRYCGLLDTALENLKKGVNEKHTQTLDKITKEQKNVKANLQKAQQDLSKAQAQQDENDHKNKLAALQAANETLENEMKSHVNKEEMTQEAADIFLLNQTKGFHEDQLEELNRYYKLVEKSQHLGEEERRQKLETLQGQIRQKQSEILTDTGKWVEKIRELTKKTESNSLKEFDLKKKEIEAKYNAIIEIEKKANQDISELIKARDAQIAALSYEKSDELYNIKKRLGIATWKDDFIHEFDELNRMLAEGEISMVQYEKALFNLKIQWAKKYFDYYAQLSGSMFSAIQDAEIAKSEAKYDVLIQQAKNNGEDTAALEEEKENKKLEIQKKYADINFAIKISQIIADTAVSIMKAFAELGPIAGGIAAAMLTATGAAQVVSAKAERDKIKNMSPSSTVASSSTATAQRVLNGFSEGGYTGDGGRYEVAGIVHKGEYVIPKPIMGDSRVIDAVGMIEALRRNRIPKQTSKNIAGFADGGFTGASQGIDPSEFRDAVREFRAATRSIKAYVVLRDIDRAREDDDRSRAPFRRKK